MFLVLLCENSQRLRVVQARVVASIITAIHGGAFQADVLGIQVVLPGLAEGADARSRARNSVRAAEPAATVR